MMVADKVIRGAALFLACLGACVLLVQPAHAAAELTSAAPAQTALPPIIFDADDLEAASDLPSSDELFAGYVARTFSGDGQSPGAPGAVEAPGKIGAMGVQKTTRGSLLADQEKVVYDALIERICEIAAGREQDAIVAIPLENLGVQHWYTAADLGLETVFDPSNPAEVSEEARQAVNGKFNVALLRILNAVLSDCPYELYWYDKTTGIAFAPPSISVVDNGEGGAIVFANPAVATFKMCVSGDYSPEGVIGAYTADTAKTGAASAAAETAQAIVAAHKGETDYEKLHAYLCAVAQLTDYDYDAAFTYDATGIYGNPWQVIHVFDGDPSTKVVCEGYAKAFQYLCDLSEFSDATIACNSVSGDMQGGTGAGPHMWNIVAIGAKNYLVDITNNDNYPDEGSTAPPSVTPGDELFLAGADPIESGGDCVGYRIEWPDAAGDANHWIEYYYDQDMYYFFSAEELALSATSYVQDIGGQGDPDPGSDPDPVPAPTDKELAAHAAALIDAIGKVSYDGRCAAAIQEARAAYDALTDAQRALVGNASALANAEARYGSLKTAADEAAAAQAAAEAARKAKEAAAVQAAADKEAAATVAAAIAKLPLAADATDRDADAARKARAKYKALSAAQKKLIPSADLKKLSSVEAAAKGTVTLNVGKVTKTAVAKALKKAGKKASSIKKIVLGAKVKRIAKGAFAKLKKAKTLVIATKKLKKSMVSGCLAKSKVTTVKVRVGTAKANKSYAKKYKKILTKRICGKTPAITA